jgi:MFS family permease
LARQIVPVLALLISTAFLLAANGMLGLLLPLRGAAEGFNTAELGLLGSAWATGFILGCLTAPIVVRRVGHIRAFASAAAGASTIILLHTMLPIPGVWIGLRIVSGFFTAGAFMIIESWLNERATNESRGSIFGVYMTVTYLGITAGQLGVGAGDPRQATPFMIGAILFALAILPTTLSTAASPRPLTRVSINLRSLFRNSPVAFLAVLMVGVVNGAFGTLSAVWGARVGLSTPVIALMISAAVVAGALLQVPIGRISDKTDRRYVIVGLALAAGAAGISIFLLRPVDATLVLALVGLYGAATYPIYGLAVAHANDYAEPSEFVAVSGGLLLLYGAGTMVGPLAGSAAMADIRPEGLFLVTATAHALIAGYAFYRTYRRAPIPESVREPFTTVPVSRALTPQTAALDPRADDITALDEPPLASVK